MCSFLLKVKNWNTCKRIELVGQHSCKYRKWRQTKKLMNSFIMDWGVRYSGRKVPN
nr:hypothetical protein [uncultured bacterium]